jgi:3-oxoacyl-[acyl-carrier protein] reductase
MSDDNAERNGLSFDFTDRTVIVTGAGRGIGLSIATGFAQAGAAVWMVDRDADIVTSEARRIGAHAAPADVSDSAEVERVVADAVEQSGRLDILVNNAGVLRDAVLWKLSDEDWNTVLGVHLGGTFRFTRACVPHFRARSWGRIINVTSYTGLHGNVGQAAYAAAKAGIIGFTKTAAKELARFGVTVNAISPNARTRMVESIPADKLDQLTALVPLGRFADADEMWPGVGFLASPEAGYVTGVVLPLDGGVAM